MFDRITFEYNPRLNKKNLEIMCTFQVTQRRQRMFDTNLTNLMKTKTSKLNFVQITKCAKYICACNGFILNK